MLVKQPIDVSFAEGLDTKTDPKRVKIGKFLRLENSVFNKGGRLQKRNGYASLASLPDTTYSYLTTFNGNLTAVGQKIAAYNAGGSSWVSRGTIQPLSLSTLPLVRNNLNQTMCDSAVAPNGLVCTVYLETNGSTTTAKYVIADATTGQNVSAPAAIPVASGAVTGGLRVFVLGNNFVIVFTNVITAVSHLQFVTVNIYNPATIGANTDIAAAYISATTLAWDAVVAAGQLYVAYNTTSGGQAIKVTYVTSGGVVATAKTFAAEIATIVSLTADNTNPARPKIYVNYYDNAGTTARTVQLDTSLNTVHGPTTVFSGAAAANVTSAAINGVCYFFWESPGSYVYDGAIAVNSIALRTINSTTVSSTIIVCRSVGLASKAFLLGGKIYVLSAYQSSYQNTYFLLDAGNSTSAAPLVVAKLAYQNGGGYLPTGLPGVTVTGTLAQVGYLYKDLIQAANKGTALASGTATAGIYSQTGINLASFTFGADSLDTAEIGSDLHIGGGFLWMYDGYLPVEHNFFLYPDYVESTTTTGAGGLTAQDYYYQVTYEWTDNQGNAFRSAPSIPIKQTTTTGSSTNTIHVPMLRVTMKTANPVKIVLYRWSTAQQNYYQVTSITTPKLNDTTADAITITDTSADSAILGNNLLYTTGGVIENVNAPATDLMTLFDTRLWMVDSEDGNLVWFSKQVIEATPVEMSDLLTMYVPPNVGTNLSTGPIRALSTMDDKVIFFKKNAIVYVNGTGPDNTGANSQYSQAIYVTSTVGCANQKSIVLTPNGLMFQSDKGIWLLDRGLETSYIGAPVEDFTLGATINSAVLVPETNQVRFTLSTGITLMYDYYYDQWGSFKNVPALSSCIFDDMHTFINSYGAVYQEAAGTYVDGSSPVLMAFKTGPLRLGDLQNYQRAYFFYILGEFLSPHKLAVGISYDYAAAPSQSVIVTPANYSPPFGSGSSQDPFGQGAPFGGPPSLEDARVFLERQRCMAFSITVQELFDPSFGTAAGAGLTLSGLSIVCAFKKGYRPQSSASSVG